MCLPPSFEEYRRHSVVIMRFLWDVFRLPFYFRNPYRNDIKFATLIFYKRADRYDDTLFMAINQILSSSAHRALAHEYKSLQDEPVEGFRVKLIEDNLREWEVAIFGPPETLYQGGYFKVPYLLLSFLFWSNSLIGPF